MITSEGLPISKIGTIPTFILVLQAVITVHCYSQAGTESRFIHTSTVRIVVEITYHGLFVLHSGRPTYCVISITIVIVRVRVRVFATIINPSSSRIWFLDPGRAPRS